jgi:hypothetical protein
VPFSFWEADFFLGKDAKIFGRKERTEGKKREEEKRGEERRRRDESSSSAQTLSRHLERA